MAEAVVDGQSSELKKFFCHMCNVEIRIPSAEYNCPLCAGGFVEEMPPSPPATPTPQNNHLPSSSNHANTRPAHRHSELESLRGEIASLLMSRNGPNLQISFEPGNGRSNLLTLAGGGFGLAGRRPNSSNPPTTSSEIITSTPTANNIGGGRVRAGNLDNLDNILMEFLQSLSTIDPVTPTTYNPHMFFVGNPGDYAWGREGLDTIVTQLLNQMETSGPPPLSTDKIDEIPKVAVTQEEVDTKMRCSVCWEDFRLEEVVRKLPCLHLYHEDCIVPWLKLHGTCPVCRKSLDEAAEEKAKANDLNSSEATSTDVVGNGVNPPNRPSDNPNPTPNTSSSQQQQSQQQQFQNTRNLNNVFNFDNNRDLPLD